jgi:hypothetical protein
MQGATKAEKHGTLDSFLLEDMPEQSVRIYDRSSLERAATCPYQAAAVEQGRVNNNSMLTAAGQEIHEAISQTLIEHVESGGKYEPGDLRSLLEQNLMGTRADVQPMALAGARASIYEIAKLIYKLDPTNILAFDGGEDLGKSGQLAIDLDGGSRVTSEVDLLYSGPSPELLHEVDWKSGWRHHSASDVFNSFQFNLHALLVFHAYEGINGLEVRVLDTRRAQWTFKVVFHRDKMGPFRIRLLSAIGAYETEVRGPNPATWPAVEKCEICPAASLCPVAGEEIKDVASDPKGYLRKLIAVEAKADAMKKLLAAHVDATGADIIDGEAGFGRQKPPSTRKVPVSIYRPSQKEEESA